MNTVNATKEQEWQEYEFAENVKQADYESLAEDSCVQQLDDEEAINLINAQYGFEKNKIKIIRNVFVYKKDRHGEIHFTTEKRERNPLYVATDCNYIRFDCCGISYEMKDGQLNFCVS